jgi:hypothetical protein
MSSPTAPPPRQAPVPPPPPSKKVEAIKNIGTEKRKKTSRQGGQRSLTINRTAPATGTTSSGAKAY